MSPIPIELCLIWRHRAPPGSPLVTAMHEVLVVFVVTDTLPQCILEITAPSLLRHLDLPPSATAMLASCIPQAEDSTKITTTTPEHNAIDALAALRSGTSILSTRHAALRAILQSGSSMEVASVASIMEGPELAMPAPRKRPLFPLLEAIKPSSVQAHKLGEALLRARAYEVALRSLEVSPLSVLETDKLVRRWCRGDAQMRRALRAAPGVKAAFGDSLGG